MQKNLLIEVKKYLSKQKFLKNMKVKVKLCEENKLEIIFQYCEEKYEEVYIDGYLLPNVWGFIKSPEFEKVDIQNVFWLDFSYLYFIRSKLLINDEDIELFNSIISSVNFMFYMKDMKEVTITDYLVIFNKIINFIDEISYDILDESCLDNLANFVISFNDFINEIKINNSFQEEKDKEKYNDNQHLYNYSIGKNYH